VASIVAVQSLYLRERKFCPVKKGLRWNRRVLGQGTKSMRQGLELLGRGFKAQEPKIWDI